MIPLSHSVLTLENSLDALEANLSDATIEDLMRWLDLPGERGIAYWGFKMRQGQRRRACDLLCQLAKIIESEAGSFQALRVLEAANRCCSLPPAAFLHAAIVASDCRIDTPFVRSLYRKARAGNYISVLSRLHYLSRDMR